MINSFNHAIGRNMITLGGRCQANWELKLAASQTSLLMKKIAVGVTKRCNIAFSLIQ